MIGGTHPTFLSGQSLEPGGIDFIVRGEGEFALRELAEAIGKGQGPETVPGLAWLDQAALKRALPGRRTLTWTTFHSRRATCSRLRNTTAWACPMGIVYKQKPFMNIVTSRGCPYRCTFCSSTNFWGNKYRTRSAGNVLDEMEELVKKYGVREFKFFDDNLTANPKRANEIFRGMINRKLGVSWNTPNGVHVASIDEETLDLMVRSGCYELTLAVESGDPVVLKDIIHKPTDLDKLLKAAKMLRQKSVGTYGFFIIGFPGETKENIQHTLDFSRKLDLDRISCFIANPLPGTEMLRICQEKGYIGKDYRFDQIDYFEGRFNTPEWTRQELFAMRRKWFWRYNLGMLARHPVRFLSRYKMLLAHPGLVI